MVVNPYSSKINWSSNCKLTVDHGCFGGASAHLFFMDIDFAVGEPFRFEKGESSIPGQLAEALGATAVPLIEGPITSMNVPRLIASMAPHEGHVTALDPAMVGTLLVGLSVDGGGSLSHHLLTATFTSSPPPTALVLLLALGTQQMIPTPRFLFLGMGTSSLHGLHSHNTFSPLGLTSRGYIWALQSIQVGLP